MRYDDTEESRWRRTRRMKQEKEGGREGGREGGGKAEEQKGYYSPNSMPCRLSKNSEKNDLTSEVVGGHVRTKQSSVCPSIATRHTGHVSLLLLLVLEISKDERRGERQRRARKERREKGRERRVVE